MKKCCLGIFTEINPGRFRRTNILPTSYFWQTRKLLQINHITASHLFLLFVQKFDEKCNNILPTLLQLLKYESSIQYFNFKLYEYTQKEKRRKNNHNKFKLSVVVYCFIIILNFDQLPVEKVFINLTLQV